MPEKSPAHDPVPDLLQRFVETPFQSELWIGRVGIALETNKPEMIEAFSAFRLSRRPYAPKGDLRWKLIVDATAMPPAAEPAVLESGPVTVAWFGPENILALDHERNEAFAFVGAAADASFSCAVLAPMLAQWTLQRRGMYVTLSQERMNAVVE